MGRKGGLFISSVCFIFLLICCGCGKQTQPQTDHTTKNEEQETDEETVEPVNTIVLAYTDASSYWDRIEAGITDEAARKHVRFDIRTLETSRPVSEQEKFLLEAVEDKPDVIAVSGFDLSTNIDGILAAQDANIPLVGFDKSIADVPENILAATVMTDQSLAGETMAEAILPAIEHQLIQESRSTPIEIGMIMQDTTDGALVERTAGAISAIREYLQDDGLLLAVKGNDLFQTEETEEDVSVQIHVAVPKTVSDSDFEKTCTKLLDQESLIAVLAMDENSGKALISSGKESGILGTNVTGIAFGGDKILQEAAENHTLTGIVSQRPYATGTMLIDMIAQVVDKKEIESQDTGTLWYTADTISLDVRRNLYD